MDSDDTRRVLLDDRGWTTQGPDDLWQHTTVRRSPRRL